MLVEKILSVARERLAAIGDDAPVLQAARFLGSPHVNLVIVCDTAGAMKGVLSKTDILKHIGHCGGNACTIAASNVMTREVFTCAPQDWLHEVWSEMRTRRLQCVPVIEPQFRPLGILYARDALRALLTEVEDEEALLREYVMSVGYR
jgi:CBS domain-containing protein